MRTKSGHSLCKTTRRNPDGVRAQLEESLIDQALERTGGNRNAAAQLLGLNRTTLVEKLKRSKKPSDS